MVPDQIDVATARAIVLHSLRVLDVALTGISAARRFATCLESGVPVDATQLRAYLPATAVAEAAVAGLRAEAAKMLAGLDAGALQPSDQGTSPGPVHALPAGVVRMWGMRLADQRCVGAIATDGALVAQTSVCAAVLVVPCATQEAALSALEHGRRRLIADGWRAIDLAAHDEPRE